MKRNFEFIDKRKLISSTEIYFLPLTYLSGIDYRMFE